MSYLSQSLKRFTHNLAAGGLGQIINLGAQVISVPLFLHYWTKSAYGEWLVLTSIPSLLWSFEGGLAGIASSRMTVAAAAENWELACALFRNVLLLQTILCAIILTGCITFVQLTDVDRVFHFSQITSRDAAWILVLMICYMIFGFFISLLRAAYRASELEARGLMVLNLWRTVDLMVTMVVLACHGHPVILALGLASSAGICMVLGTCDVRHKCPRIRFSLRGTSWVQCRGLMIDGFPMLVGMAANALSLQGYPLVVNRVLGSGSVVNLTGVRTVSRAVLQGIQLLSGSSAPELSRTYGRGDKEGYLRLLKIIVAASFWGGVLSCVGLPLFGPWVIREWSSGKIAIDSVTLLFFGITIGLQGAWNICSTILVASNRHHLFNYLYFAFTLAALLVSPYFMSVYGFRSIPLVIMSADLSLLLAGILLCHKKLTHISLWELVCVFNPMFYMRKAIELWGKAMDRLSQLSRMAAR